MHFMSNRFSDALSEHQGSVGKIFEWLSPAVRTDEEREKESTRMQEQVKDPQELFRIAYDEYADAIYRHCYFRVFRRERAEELMQETFMKTWQYIASGHHVDNVRAFLYRVANNLIIDESRRKKESSLENLMENGLDFGRDDRNRLESHLDANAVIALLENLNERYRKVILMRYIDDLQPEEIAQITGDTPNAVSVCLHRALKQIRAITSEQENMQETI